MKLFLRTLRLLTFVILFTLTTITPLYAATIRSGENISLSEDIRNLEDLYLFGGSILLDAPVENDVVAAGGTVTINGDVSGSILAAGGTISIDSSVGNTIRIAGGTVTISGTVARDVIVNGGTLTLTKDARINGDVVANGGTILLQGPVRGWVHANGGDVTVNNTVGGSVQGHIDTLTLGSNASIDGDLTYTSGKKALLENGAIVRGKQNFTQEKQDYDDDQTENVFGAVASGALYKLAVEILLALLLITFLPRFIMQSVSQISHEPLKTGLAGLATLVFMPILSIFLLILIWIGIGSFLLYFLLLLLAMAVANLFVGEWAMRTWLKRRGVPYLIDWRAAVAGPLITTILLFIPVLGWIAGFILFLLGLGGLVLSLYNWITLSRLAYREQATLKKHDAVPASAQSTTASKSKSHK